MTLPEQLTVLRALLPIFELVPVVTSELKRRGFCSFLPVPPESHPSEYSWSDIRVSDIVAIERAKERFAWPSHSWEGPRYRREVEKLIYRSPIIERLEGERIAIVRRKYAGVSAGIPDWEYEIDPVLRKNREESQRGNDVEQARRNTRDVTIRHRRSKEVSGISTSLSDEFPATDDGCKSLVAEAMLRASIQLGFAVDAKRGNRRDLYFSKRLTEGWDLCFVLSGLDWLSGNGRIQMLLAAIPSGWTTRPGDQRESDFLFVDYTQVLPYFALYEFFRTLKELEVSIIANFTLYELLMSHLEALLVRHLPG
jgi:hypothetical protein